MSWSLFYSENGLFRVDLSITWFEFFDYVKCKISSFFDTDVEVVLISCHILIINDTERVNLSL